MQSVTTQGATGAPAPNLPVPKKKHKWPIRLAIILIIIGLAGALLLHSISSAGKQLASSLYIPATADIGEITVQVSGSAVVEPNNSYRVTALVTGEILDAPFQVGDTVQKGDVLYQIDSSDLENSIAQARLSVEQAQLSYDSLIATQGDSALKSTDTGIITKLYVDEGDYVTSGSPIIDILDRNTMTLELPFHSSQAQGFQIGQSAVVLAGDALEPLTGTITQISPINEVGAGGALTRKVTIQVANPGALTEGMTGTATVGEASCSAVGTFSYSAQSTVHARNNGTLSELYVSEGDWVSKNQTLGSYNNDSISTQVESARISLETAQLALKNAQDRLEDYTITSPISGTVIEKNFQAGDNLEAGAGYLAVIFDMSTLTFDMNVDELYISQVRPGQKVEITADAAEGQTFHGWVETININGTTMGGVTNYPVTVVIDNGEDLLPGMNVSAHILVERAENVLRIPVGAVQRGNTVLLAGVDAFDDQGNLLPDRLVETTVELGRNDEDYIEVRSGLDEGDTVAIVNTASSIYELMGMAMTASPGNMGDIP